MADPIHAFDFCRGQAAADVPPVCAVFGDEPFLKRLVLARLRRLVLSDDSDEAASEVDGAAAQWRDVRDELATVSLFGGSRRLAIVDPGDDFVARYRGELESYVKRPQRNGVLVLVAGAWASNTRLYKALAKSGWQIDCRAPQIKKGRRAVLDEQRLRGWLCDWAAERHAAALAPAAAELMLDLIGPDLGLLDQELAKLALFVEGDKKVTPELVRDVVGGWKTKTVWELVDAAADGNAADALRQLDQLLAGGENPLALLGRMAWSFRRYAVAVRLFEAAERRGRKMSLSAALEAAGFRKWPRDALARAERQLRQMGRRRAGQLHSQLLEADLELKGAHSTAPRARLVLEVLLTNLARDLERPSSAGGAVSRSARPANC